MRAALLLILSSSLACGTTEGESLADLSWRFDYADPTEAGASEIRDCSNVRTNNPGPAYPVIDKVHLTLVDPEGMVQGVDTEYACDLGYRGKRVGIQGVVLQTYELTLEAKSADGTVLYRYQDDEYDLSDGYREDDLTLPTATGEIHFFSSFNGDLACPGNVASIRTTLFRKVGGVAPDEDTLTLTHTPACESGFSSEVFVRALPVFFENPLQTFNDYKMVVEALDGAGDTRHYGINQNRIVRLGDNSLGANESLAPGSLP